AAEQLGGPVWVVKAQIHAGGRGKAGGVKVVKSLDAVRSEAQRLLDSTLVTEQTGPEGKIVRRLYVEEGSAIDREFYLSALAHRYAAFLAKDMSLLEINPLVLTKAGALICLDAKIGFDDSALYRHPDIVALRDLSEEDEKEIAASRHELSYIALDGSIGCMVNGAVLAMATMDIIKLYGGAPANFLDVGGGASRERASAACTSITADPT